ncbi:MAG TPA: TonB-dependent receptor [Bryobacteraceae bacterium]|nr:TonB-dependent receptor [Bryobacteraceae bacterium]
MKEKRIPAFAGFLLLSCISIAPAQSLGSAGTINGVVNDPSGAAVPDAAIELKNPITGYTRTATTGPTGTFQFLNVPFNQYHMSVTAAGFAAFDQDVTVHTAVPLPFTVQLSLSGQQAAITVEASGAGMLENVPYAHTDLDQSSYATMPALSPASGLSDAITMSSPGVVADSNGFFHPLGDHAQTTFSVDGQPISDQQSKQFSTQIPLNAIQSMELITSSPSAEFGDKTSLVVSATTRSGLGQKPFGSFQTGYGSFGSLSEDATLGLGGNRWGNFIAADSLRSGRFLDTPEFRPLHDIGNSGTIFDRFDWQPDNTNTFHLNILAARNWFQVPNTYDQLSQDQRQRVMTYNLAPSYQHTFGAGALLSINTFLRHDQVNYHPSRDPLDDSPVTASQYRTLTNYGVRADYAYAHHHHNLKIGTQVMQTRLDERFAFGITDPAFNAVCTDAAGADQLLPGITDPAQCDALGYQPSPSFQPGLVAFDLTRGGSPFQFADKANINQYAVYAQDSITLGNLTLSPGLRLDRYKGLTQATGVQPRFGASYLLKTTGTVLRAGYARTFETPYNENLILSSATGAGGLATNIFGAYASEPIEPGRRNSYNAGLEQSFGRLFQIDADYFWKFTDNAFDFGTLLNTPIVFPISWRESKIDGVSLRLSTTNIHGFQANTTMGHTRARYYGPSNGGLVFNSPLDTGVFRIDHDEALEQTTHVVYQRPKNGPWIAFTWRFDSGLVAGSVEDLDDALALTADQQAAIGFYCGSQHATLGNPITSCSSNFGATRLRIPAPGTADDDHNPPRIAPRHLFDISAGTNNLFHTEGVRTTLKFSVTNLTNVTALYNFLSTFSGTHFVVPRSFEMQIGVAF